MILGPDMFWVCFELLILIQKHDLNVSKVVQNLLGADPSLLDYLWDDFRIT